MESQLFRSKEYYERYNSTVCLIEPDHDEPFVINSNIQGDPDEMDTDVPVNTDTLAKLQIMFNFR